MDSQSFPRLVYGKILWEQKAHVLLGACILALYTALGFIRDDLLPYGVEQKWWDASVQSHLTVLDLLGDFSWRSWAIVALLIILSLGFEASYRLQNKNHKEFSSLEGEIQRLIRDATPTIALRIEPRHFVRWSKMGGTTESVLLLSVENVGAKTLDDCQIKLSYHSVADKQRSRLSQFTLCPPFTLVPDDSKPIPVLAARHNMDAGDDYLRPVHYVNDKGEWRESDVGVLMGPNTWLITISALSRHTRRAVFEFAVRYADKEWEVVDASVPP